MKNVMCRITAAVLTVLMFFTFVPSMVFAEELKTITEITIVGEKPCSGKRYAYYSQAYPEGIVRSEYKYDVESGSGVSVTTDKWYVVGFGEFGEVVKFGDGVPYLLIMYFDLEEGYRIPENLKDVDVTLKYKNGEIVKLPKESYRTEKDFLDGVDTYTLFPYTEDNGSTKLIFYYVMENNPMEFPPLHISTRNPVVGEVVKNNPEYDVYINNNTSALHVLDENMFPRYKNSKCWTELKPNGELVPAEKIVPGRTYVLSLCLGFSVPYRGINKVPNAEDININIGFTNDDYLELKREDYRAPSDFKYENGTYTIKDIERDDQSCTIQFLYSVKIDPVILNNKVQNNVSSDTKSDESQTQSEEINSEKISETQKSDIIKSEKMSNGLRIGIIAGTAILAVILIGGGALYMIYRKKKI